MSITKAVEQRTPKAVEGTVTVHKVDPDKPKGTGMTPASTEAMESLKAKFSK